MSSAVIARIIITSIEVTTTRHDSVRWASARLLLPEGVEGLHGRAGKLALPIPTQGAGHCIAALEQLKGAV